MSHEHHPGCGHLAEQHDADHLGELAHHAGSMCCAGQCQHPEHLGVPAWLEAQQLLADDEELDEFGVKKKKKKQQLGRLGIYLAESSSAPKAA